MDDQYHYLRTKEICSPHEQDEEQLQFLLPEKGQNL